MGMRMKEINYNAPAKQILATPDHYVAIGFKHPQATALATGNAVLENGRYIVKAGTIYPANDATAKGIVLNDYDVTDGDAQIAVVVHGFIKTAALPEEPEVTAIGALRQINFTKAVTSKPVEPPTITYTLTNADLTEAVANDGTLENGEVGIEIANATFLSDIAKSDIIISNLPTGMDYTVSYVTENSITITITGTATENEAVNSVNLEVTIKKEVIETATTDLQIEDISITFTDAPEVFEGQVIITTTKSTGETGDKTVPEDAVVTIKNARFDKTSATSELNWGIGTDTDEIEIDTITISEDGKTATFKFKFASGITTLTQPGIIQVYTIKNTCEVVDPNRNFAEYASEEITILEIL